MKAIQHYWKRLVSQTPKALKKLRNLCAGVSAGLFASVALIDQFSIATDWKELLVKIAIVAAGISAGIAGGAQFATTDPNLQEEKIG
jgi:hypothetical protein